MKHRFWILSATLCLSFVLCDAHVSIADSNAQPTVETIRNQYTKALDVKFNDFNKQAEAFNKNKSNNNLLAIFNTVKKAYEVHKEYREKYDKFLSNVVPKQYEIDLVTIQIYAAYYIENFIRDLPENNDLWAPKRDVIITNTWRLVNMHPSYKQELVSKEDAATLKRICPNCQDEASAESNSNPYVTSSPTSSVPTPDPTPIPRPTPKPSLAPTPTPSPEASASAEPSPHSAPSSGDTTNCEEPYEPEELLKQLDSLEKDLASGKLETALKQVKAIAIFESDIDCMLKKDVSKYQPVLERYLQLVMKLTDKLLEKGIREKKISVISQARDLWESDTREHFEQYLSNDFSKDAPVSRYIQLKLEVYDAELKNTQKKQMELVRFQSEIKGYLEFKRLNLFDPQDVQHFLDFLATKIK